ncbi:polyphosphate polymerase domain-containing protein [Blastococcus sp. PRF04-17]|uniref:polyphosphate polymerase domain-containing protein n=1 Tax=Blastococcus sp. PRF04-17 TaxID=2933797 RepID=UPI001FF67693|nr:polyphosphate polymerase domain-containing protein [Blastococcus sp. PRF04-17]UOY02441.1 polyphosphate polymerase domain-containing protein [Blastococcus sp. PRF04-17]
MTAVAPPVLPATSGLLPIDLEELVARAALQTRVDRKYVLPLTAADRFVTGLARAEEVRVLEIGGRRSAGYASQYLDTSDLAGYHLAARGRRRRFKVRRRTYLDSGDAYLEVKTRGMRGATVKERIPVAGPSTACDFIDAVLTRTGLGWVRGRDLRPALYTAYRRSTLLLPASDTRVTVDTELIWSLPGGPDAHLDGLAIVETKSTGCASTADRLLWRSGFRPSRISKYGTGLAALRGDLPDNRWCPVLRRHFSLLTPRTCDERTLP